MTPTRIEAVSLVLLALCACAGAPERITAAWSGARPTSASAPLDAQLEIRASAGESVVALRDARLTSLTRRSCVPASSIECDGAGVCRGSIVIEPPYACVIGVEALTRGGALLTSCQEYPSGRENVSAGCRDWARSRELAQHQSTRRPANRATHLH